MSYLLVVVILMSEAKGRRGGLVPLDQAHSVIGGLDGVADSDDVVCLSQEEVETVVLIIEVQLGRSAGRLIV